MAPQIVAPQTDTQTIVERPCFAFAYIDQLDRTLTTYVSTLLDDDDPWLSPIHVLLPAATLVKRSIVADPNMMFGQAEHSIYSLGEV